MNFKMPTTVVRGEKLRTEFTKIHEVELPAERSKLERLRSDRARVEYERRVNGGGDAGANLDAEVMGCERRIETLERVLVQLESELIGSAEAIAGGRTEVHRVSGAEAARLTAKGQEPIRPRVEPLRADFAKLLAVSKLGLPGTLHPADLDSPFATPRLPVCIGGVEFFHQVEPDPVEVTRLEKEYAPLLRAVKTADSLFDFVTELVREQHRRKQAAEPVTPLLGVTVRPMTVNDL